MGSMLLQHLHCRTWQSLLFACAVCGLQFKMVSDSIIFKLVFNFLLCLYDYCFCIFPIEFFVAFERYVQPYSSCSCRTLEDKLVEKQVVFYPLKHAFASFRCTYAYVCRFAFGVLREESATNGNVKVRRTESGCDCDWSENLA